MKENKWTYLSIVLVLLNTNLSWIEASKRAFPTSQMVGYILSVVLLPIIVVGIFQIFKKFRNSRSRVKVFFWVSLFIFVSKVASFLKLTYNA